MKPKTCKNPMPEPIGVFWCRLKPRHKGPCSYKGFFNDSGNGEVRVCMDIAWTSPAQLKQRKRDEVERQRLLRSIRG